MRKWFATCAWLGIFGLAAATLAAHEGERFWLLELAAHFRPHLAAVSAVWLLFALLQHRPLAVIASAALLVANAAPVAPYVAAGAQAAAAQGSPLRVMTYNMHGRATRRAAFLEFVHTERPHVILLTELPPARAWVSETLGADYPYRLDVASGSPHGLLLLSRWPITGSQIDRRVAPGQPVFAADLCAETATGSDNHCVRLVGLHAVAPIGPPATARQNAQFAVAANMARAAPAGHAILAGDLNMTPWAPRFHRLLDAAGVNDAAVGRGLTATWFSRQPMVGLVIDHVLASPQIAARGFLVGPDLGSDHLPVVADLVLPGPERETARPMR